MRTLPDTPSLLQPNPANAGCTVIRMRPSPTIERRIQAAIMVSPVKLLASVEPNVTLVASVKLAPRMVTEVPPVPGPALGFTFATVGDGLEAYVALTLVVRAKRPSETSAVAESERRGNVALGRSASR